MGHEDLLRAFLAAQLDGDRRGAVRLVVDAARSGVSPRTLQIEVIAGAQREIGRLWELNRVSIAQEHLATAIAQLALARLNGQVEDDLPPAIGWKVLVACVEGERHDLGARIAADVLENAGYEVKFLGADVPTDALVAFARTERPDVICLTTTMVFHLPALRSAVARLREAVPGIRILAGGWAVEQIGGAPDGALRAGVTAEDLLNALSELRRMAA